MKMPPQLGMLLLGIWLIVYGLLTNSILHISFTHSGDVMAIFAIVVGVLLLLHR